MSAVSAQLRAQMRRNRRATIALVLLIGLAGGFVLAAAVAARRTGSAYERFLAGHPGADVFLPNPAFGHQFGAMVHDPAEIGAMPQVAAMSVGRVAISQWGEGFAAYDERFGFEVPRWKILEGRAYDPARIDEAVAFHTFAEEHGLGVGDRINYPGEAPEGVPDECARIGDGPQIELTIVGIAVAPGPFFAPAGESPWSLALTPPLAARLPSLAEETGCSFLAFDTAGMMWIRTHPGMADAFIATLDEAADTRFVISEPQTTYDERNRETILMQGRALGVLAAAAAIAVLLVLSQTIARQVRLEADDHPTLRALGLTRVQLSLPALLRVAVAAAAGAALAVGVAYAMSPLTPLGVARLAEPSPGLAFDGAVLGIGAVAIVVLFALISLPPAWLASRARPGAPPTRPSSAVRFASSVGLPAPAVAGLRLAFEPGSGRTSVPVRTSIAGIAFGVAMLTIALSFGASATHLIANPAAYGMTVDIWMNADATGEYFPFVDHVDAIRAHPDVTGAAIGTPGMTMQVDGRPVSVLDFEPVVGDVQPQVIRGRYPDAADEILLGSRTAGLLGRDAGDTVTVQARTEEDDAPRVERALTVVGIGVIPPFERSGLGEGAIITLEGAASLAPDGLAGYGVFLRLRPGADPNEVVGDLKRAMGNDMLDQWGAAPPADVVDFGRVQNLPAVVAGVLGLLALGTLAHVLVTAVRRRRRDLAVLKTIGFVRRQVRATVVWQATATVLLAVAVAIPAGIIGGRWLWTAFVERIGLLPEPVVPILVLALVVPAALVAANLIAAGPAWSAARTRPAEALRAE